MYGIRSVMGAGCAQSIQNMASVQMTIVLMEKGEPMAEYIEREALMKNFCGYELTKCVKYGNKDADQRHNSYSTMMMYEIADEIIDAPAADVAPVVHGRWETANDGTHFCSNCGWDATYTWDDIDRSFINSADDVPDRITNYCHNCGARMDLEV